MHFKIALNAINARINLLCEKPFALNVDPNRILIEASRKMGALLVEASIWTRFFPAITELQSILHEKKVIGDISRVFVDFVLEMSLSKLPPASRSADPALVAGVLLDIGVYTLTWADIILKGCLPEFEKCQKPEALSSMSFCNGTDEITSIIMNYRDMNAEAICTSSYCYSSIGGIAGSNPEYLAIWKLGKGFFYEQDDVGEDAMAGRTESGIVLWQKMENTMVLVESIRFANGLNAIDCRALARTNAYA
ncbi:D-xylose 1-dehydrogenase (NADP(+)) [Penicillium antarcticum]|uniref:D-xylose 1-dehydrogenase (NADP(+)) n=1 Tax=Penicillium antarcticum TaxID=416450 RepID=UPI0023A714F1|nr:D-xylose 1-dehydrogenase (NADP(+)) [Penicillium antarcticum]KAJ5320313.1 D-xylose 1-dehydrogenase (NADP(+)) [Penicillium antarcticum]